MKGHISYIQILEISKSRLHSHYHNTNCVKKLHETWNRIIIVKQIVSALIVVYVGIARSIPSAKYNIPATYHSMTEYLHMTPIPWNSVLLEDLLVIFAQLVKMFSIFYLKISFITSYTSTHQWSAP